MDVAITKMSSKGQIVIPAEMRGDIKEGEKMIIIKNENQFVMKKATELDRNLDADLKFAKRTEEAWKKYENKEFVKMGFDDFLKEIKKG